MHILVCIRDGDYGGDVALDRAPSGGTVATLRIGDGPAGDM